MSYTVQSKKEHMKTGLKISEVRDEEFAEVDDKRAVNALDLIWEASQGDDEITLNGAECSMVIAMLQSQEYFKLIAEKSFMAMAKDEINSAADLTAESNKESSHSNIVFKVDDEQIRVGGEVRIEIELDNDQQMCVVLTHEGIITDCFRIGENVATSSITYEERFLSLVEDN